MAGMLHSVYAKSFWQIPQPCCVSSTRKASRRLYFLILCRSCRSFFNLQSLVDDSSVPTFRTGRSEVMRRGCCALSWPTSDAHVSPQQHAK